MKRAENNTIMNRLRTLQKALAKEERIVKRERKHYEQNQKSSKKLLPRRKMNRRSVARRRTIVRNIAALRARPQGRDLDRARAFLELQSNF